MAEERTRLSSSAATASVSVYNSVNSPIGSDTSFDVENENPLKRQWRELTSGKQRLRVVLLFSCIAGMGSCITGFTLGFSSLAQIDLEDKISTFAVPTKTDFKYIGVSKYTVFTQPPIINLRKY